MPNSRSRSIPQLRIRKRTKPKKRSSVEVTRDEVIDNLLDLFQRLEVDKKFPDTKATDPDESKISHDLYPFMSDICELLTWWHQNPQYLDDEGNPLPIKARGTRPSFQHLAQRKVKRVNESFLLSELERLGAVTTDERGLIHVHVRSFPMYEDKRLATQHTLTALDGFIRTLRHNLDSAPSNSDQLFHRLAWNGNFDSREIPKLKIRVKRHGQSFLESFDNWLGIRSLAKTPKSKSPAGRAQVSIGVYLSVKNKRKT